jgi:hypothetical protein
VIFRGFSLGEDFIASDIVDKLGGGMKFFSKRVFANSVSVDFSVLLSRFSIQGLGGYILLSILPPNP